MKEHNDLEIVNANELPSIQDTLQVIHDIHKNAIIHEVNNNQEIQNKFSEQARKSVDHELDSIEQENLLRRKKATYDANKEACRVYGVSEHVPIWQIRLMRFGAGFWFIIYFIFATITIAPINIFFKGIKHFINNNYIVFIFAIICYLIIVIGIPFIFKFI